MAVRDGELTGIGGRQHGRPDCEVAFFESVEVPKVPGSLFDAQPVNESRLRYLAHLLLQGFQERSEPLALG
jgi:hypothetical protein